MKLRSGKKVCIKFAQINPLLSSLKHKIDEDTARFQREYDFEGNDLSLFPNYS